MSEDVIVLSSDSDGEPQNGTTTTSSTPVAKKRTSTSVNEKLARTMKSLELTTKDMDEFNPEMSNREKRKLTKKIKKSENSAKTLAADADLDLCDCIDLDCPGCWFPCRNCRSSKCGIDCREGRRTIVESLENQADNTVRINPVLRPDI